MGAVLIFPNQGRHDRTPTRTGGRAAKRTMSSAVTPPAFAVSESRIELHHSSGMRSRQAHLRAECTLAPTSAAKASGVGHSPMTSLNELKRVGEATSVMPPCLGQSVLKSKANVSYDCGERLPHPAAMADRMSETEEKLAFINRVKLARMSRFETQKPILTILGVDQGTYKQYETRTPLPHRYIPKFCAATGVEIEWLLTGEGKGPTQVYELAPSPRRKRRAMSKSRAA